MKLKKSISSLKLPHHKGTASKQSERVAPPAEVLLPMNMHGGAAAVPVVSVGDYVRVGQKIGEEEGRFSVRVHASVSGTVTAIEDYRASGRPCKAVRIASDGKMELDPSVKAPKLESREDFLNALHDSGIVGLGGAAFPLYGKLDAIRNGPIHTVLVNGAECEPFITSDHRTMLEDTDYVVKGVELLLKYLESERVIIGIEDNKRDAIELLKQRFADNSAVEVKALKSVYPQGAKQVLLYNAAGLVTEEGQRLASLGYIIINITTLAKMAEFIETGLPLVDRRVTVDGSAVKEPKNIIVPLGTPISYLVENCGGLKEAAGKIISGGPMMGKTVSSMDAPVIKASNAVLIFNEKDAKLSEPSPCIHCGRCVEICPLGLDPVGYSKAWETEDEEKRYELLCKGKVTNCMECGCCSYVCPAHRPLAEVNGKARAFVRKKNSEKKGGR